MISFFANIFGYLLNYIYNLINNYGLAIIIFSVALKIILLPISIKQQQTMKKTSKVQSQMKELQDKYKSNPEKLNQEMMALYKKEKVSPFSGCLSAIIQIVLLFSVFYLVRNPLTYMKKIDQDLINTYKEELGQEQTLNTAYPEISIIKEKGSVDETVSMNMEFLGIDLSSVPTQDSSNIKTWIIPVLYVISSILSIRITSRMQTNTTQKAKEVELDENGNPKQNQADPMAQTSKMMNWFMPVMSVSIAMVAPLGLALYWLMNNILMIAERVILDKVLNKEEAEDA